MTTTVVGHQNRAGSLPPPAPPSTEPDVSIDVSDTEDEANATEISPHIVDLLNQASAVIRDERAKNETLQRELEDITKHLHHLVYLALEDGKAGVLQQTAQSKVWSYISANTSVWTKLCGISIVLPPSASSSSAAANTAPSGVEPRSAASAPALPAMSMSNGKKAGSPPAVPPSRSSSRGEPSTSSARSHSKTTSGGGYARRLSGSGGNLLQTASPPTPTTTTTIPTATTLTPVSAAAPLPPPTAPTPRPADTTAPAPAPTAAAGGAAGVIVPLSTPETATPMHHHHPLLPVSVPTSAAEAGMIARLRRAMAPPPSKAQLGDVVDAMVGELRKEIRQKLESKTLRWPPVEKSAQPNSIYHFIPWTIHIERENVCAYRFMIGPEESIRTVVEARKKRPGVLVDALLLQNQRERERGKKIPKLEVKHFLLNLTIDSGKLMVASGGGHVDLLEILQRKIQLRL